MADQSLPPRQPGSPDEAHSPDEPRSPATDAGAGADTGVAERSVGSPGAGSVAVIFTSRRACGADGTVVDDAGYEAMAAHMGRLAAQQPGYLGVDSVRGADGFGITVSYWASDGDAAAWKQVTEHLGAQHLGRERWYDSYATHVAHIARSYEWRRDDPRPPGGPTATHR